MRCLRIPLYLFAILLGWAVTSTAPAQSSTNTVNPTYIYANFSLQASNLATISLTPLAAAGDYFGTILYSNTVTFAVTNTNSFTFTNVVSGYAYRITFADIYGYSSQITNFFPATDSGPISGQLRQTQSLGFDALGRVISAAYVYPFQTGTWALTNLFATNIYGSFYDVGGTNAQQAQLLVASNAAVAANLAVSNWAAATFQTIAGLGTMAFQPTNSPNFQTATNRGSFTMVSNSPTDLGNVTMPFNSSVVFASGSITDEQNHGPQSGQMEFAINATARLETSWGGNDQKDNAWQIGASFQGNSQGYASPAYWNGDNWADASGTNWLGYGVLEIKTIPYQENEGTGADYLWGWRGEAKTTNGLFAMVAYNVENENALIGQSPGVPSGLEWWNNGIVVHGKDTRDYPQLGNLTNYGMSFDTNLDGEIDTLTNLVVTNIPDNYARTNQRDTATVTIFNTVNAITVTTPATWIWASGSTNLASAPSNLPPLEVMEITVKRKIGSGTNFFASANFYTNSQFQWDPNALFFFQSTGISDNVNKIAVNQLVTSLKGANLWSIWDAIYPMVGGTSNTCSFNLAAPTNNTSLYRVAWTVGASTFAQNGWTSDGSASFANTGFNPSSASSPNYLAQSATMLFYNGTASPVITGGTPAYFIGATATHRAGITENSTAGFGIDGFNNTSGAGSLSGAMPSPFNGTTAYATGASGLVCFSPTGSFSNAGLGTGVPELPIYIGARNNSGSAGGFIGARFSLVMIGGAINSMQYQTLTNIVAVFEAQRGGQ